MDTMIIGETQKEFMTNKRKAAKRLKEKIEAENAIYKIRRKSNESIWDGGQSRKLRKSNLLFV